MQDQAQFTALPLTMAWTQGMYQLFPHFLAKVSYSPDYVLMSEDTWNDLTPEIQDLISDTIMPELQDYVTNVSLTQHKEALKGLVDNTQSVHFVSPERDLQLYDVLVTTQPWIDLEELMDPEVMALIDALRPTTAIMDPEYQEMLEYAGLIQE